ncbi:MAG: ABC-type transport system involved in cytochrome c biogenesis permease subunit [Myxococcota bacterium]
MERIPYIFVLACYAIATIGHLLPGVLGARVEARVRTVVAVGAVAHLLTLVGGAALSILPPGFPEALSATSLGIVLAYVWVGEGRLRAVGMLMVPLALVLLGTSQVVPHHQVAALADTGRSAWLPLHLGLVFAGIGGFGLSSAVGVVYLWTRRRLKAKRFDGLGRMPSLEVLDRIQFRAMLFGFTFLTLGIGAGGAWAAASLHEAWSVDPKVLFTLLIWLWYGAALQVRLVLGRRGRWTALFSIAGFGGLVFSLLGVNFLVAGWHGYG